MSQPAMSREQNAPLVAWSLASLCIALAAVGSILAAAGPGGSIPLKQLVVAVIWAVPGALVAAGRPRIAVGWLLLGVALIFGGSALAEEWVAYATARQVQAGVDWAIWFVDRFSAFLVVLTFMALVLLPDGRLPSRRWGAVVWPVVALQCLALAVWSAAQGPAAAPDSDFPASLASIPNPFGVLPGGWASIVQAAEPLIVSAPLLLCPVAFGVRLLRARGDDRSGLAALLLAAGAFVLAVVLGHTLWPAGAGALDIAGGVVLAAALTTAVLKGRLEGVRVVVHHAIVYLLLTLVIAMLYAGIVALAARFGQEPSPFGGGVIVAAVALAALPLRDRLQRLVDRTIYGDRSHPHEGLRRLAAETEEAVSLNSVLNALAATVAQSLRVPWVEVATPDDTVAAGSLPPHAPTTTAPLMSQGTEVGSISVAPGPGRALREDDLRLLHDLARYGGVVVHSILLADAVRASRQRLVMAREEERRRLRRDLHDQLGPTLASIGMQLGAVRSLVHEDPDSAANRLAALQAAANSALHDVRRVTRELRPPVLDELGLLPALGQLADGLGVDLETTDLEAPQLPAGLEVALYRIGAEALTNVARHSGTNRAALCLSASDGHVHLEVSDEGHGVSDTFAPGVGISGMRERAEELGGTLAVESTPDRGTRITAVLPLAAVERTGE